MSETNGMTAAFDGTPAFESPCNRCGEPVQVSVAALDACKHVNHVLDTMGERLLRKSDIALCRPCYDLHYQELWAKQQKESQTAEFLWSAFRKAYRAASEDRRPAILDQLRSTLGDYWPSYSGLATGWIAELRSKKARGTSGVESGAGF